MAQALIEGKCFAKLVSLVCFTSVCPHGPLCAVEPSHGFPALWDGGSTGQEPIQCDSEQIDSMSECRRSVLEAAIEFTSQEARTIADM